jgi:hypothetical protein
VPLVEVNIYHPPNYTTLANYWLCLVWKAGGQTPFTRGEVTWRDGTVWYNISPLYGYNRALKASQIIQPA